MNHCGIHSVISSDFAACRASCVVRFACGKTTTNIRVDAAVNHYPSKALAKLSPQHGNWFHSTRHEKSELLYPHRSHGTVVPLERRHGMQRPAPAPDPIPGAGAVRATVQSWSTYPEEPGKGPLQFAHDFAGFLRVCAPAPESSSNWSGASTPTVCLSFSYQDVNFKPLRHEVVLPYDIV